MAERFLADTYCKWPGNVVNEIISLEDWMPTLASAAGQKPIAGMEKARNRKCQLVRSPDIGY